MWERIKKAQLEECLGGDKRLESRLCQHINRMLGNPEIIRTLTIPYPECGEPNNSGQIMGDANYMAKVRNRMARYMAKTFTGGGDENKNERYILAYLQYNWGEVMNRYLTTVKEALPKILKFKRFL